MKNNICYIGITDFETPEQAQKMLDIFAELIQGKQPRKLMVGIMSSYKTLNGIDTKWAKAWPTNEGVGDFFKPHPLALNTLHYADFAQATTSKDLIQAVQFADTHGGLDALQLDMPWPDPVMLSEAIRNFAPLKKRQMPIILQVGSVAIKQCGGNMADVVKMLFRYENIISHILLDLSGGKGIAMDTNVIRMQIRMIKDHYGDKFAIAVAGGLGPDTMNLIHPLLGEFPDLSIDAQGKLHVDGDALKPSDPVKQEAYLRAAVPMFL